MIIGKVFQNERMIAEGISTGGKKYSKMNPEQYIYLTPDTESNTEQKFTHNDEENIYFIEFQDNGKGWEPVYDSRERIDRTVEYELPSWFVNGGPVPKHQHTYKDGDIETTFKGYYK
ncbi:hypothetical protein HUN92_13705 [Bacillus firmus]|uniref:hypothetical protein n=1 Tax=Cytobacillus firmus TaxID=1399 RepID=UPI00157FCDA2|nr:hypothetical protein [Cytobacillus firmus]NUH84775.1 hypothetical protein [Cytobacillus firmus]